MIRGLVIGKFIPVHKGHIAALDARNIPYIIIEGDYKQRAEIIVNEVNKLMQKF